MRQNALRNVDANSLLLGAMMGILFTVLAGAAASEATKPRIVPLRFLVLDAAPQDGTAASCKAVLLKVCPHYGKITSDSLKKRMVQETQELAICVEAEPGTALECDIGRGDVIAFDTFQHIKLSAGSSESRHLPAGGIEPVHR